MLYLLVFLKIPILFACLIVWWAVKQGTDTDDATARERRRHADPPAAASAAPPAPAPAPPRRPARRRRAAGPAVPDPLGDGRRPRPRARALRSLGGRPTGHSVRCDVPSGTPRLPRVPVSVLSDGTIRRLVEDGRIVIKPWNPELVQPASIDLRLGDSFRVFHNHRAPVIDLRDGPPPGLTEEVQATAEDGFVIHPGEFCLGRTEEWVELPEDVVARIEGKSSLGRLGLIVHATAGFIDPGVEGHADARAQQPHPGARSSCIPGC